MRQRRHASAIPWRRSVHTTTTTARHTNTATSDAINATLLPPICDAVMLSTCCCDAGVDELAAISEFVNDVTSLVDKFCCIVVATVEDSVLVGKGSRKVVDNGVVTEAMLGCCVVGSGLSGIVVVGADLDETTEAVEETANVVVVAVSV